MSETTHRAFRLATASLLLVALVAQLAIGMSRNDLGLVNFLSFFTILSNLAAVAVLVILAVRPARSEGGTFTVVRGAVTVYMAVTGLVYATLLAPTGVDVGLTEPWVNWSLHVIGPAVMIADWIAFRPPRNLSWRTLAVWLVFPAVYLGYTLIRGGIVDWYPYPFLDPSETGGYLMVAVWAGVVLVVILGFGAAFLWWANRREEAAA